MPRFFVPEKQIENGTVRIFGEDASHISYSLRMAKGEHITVCDEAAREYECILSELTRELVVAQIIEEKIGDTESPLRITLYQALPKGDKLETVIQKAVECGVFEIVPFESERCVVKVKADAEERKTIRRNRISQEAAKQCGRGRVPRVSETVSFEQALEKASGADIRLICYEDENGTSIKQALQAMPFASGSTVSIIIGSEGGFSTEEVEAAKERGMISVSLGKRILRTETAPVFVLSCLAYQFEL